MIQDESKIYLRGFTKVVIFVGLLSFFQSPAFARVVDGSVSRIGDATHLEFSGLEQWNYNLKKTGDQEFTLVVPEFNKKTETELRTWTGQFIDGIEVSKNGSDNRYKVIFRVSDKEVESFDYLTDQPSRLIIDFFKQVEPIKKQSKSQNSSGQKAAEPKKKKVLSGVTKTKEKKGKYTKYQRNSDGSRRPAGESATGGCRANGCGRGDCR